MALLSKGFRFNLRERVRVHRRGEDSGDPAYQQCWEGML